MQRFFQTLVVFFLFSAFTFGGPDGKKVVIFYSSIGQGHISAAKAIEADIKKKDPTAKVELKNIRDFWSYTYSKGVDEKLYWYFVKNRPNTFDKMYKGFMQSGKNASELDDLTKYYDENKIREYLQKEGADVVLSTFYGAAQIMANIRRSGHLQDVPTGWLHTDYMEGYFPRISKAIDQSFLPHPELEKIWAAAGVDPAKFTTTGMPLNPKIFDRINKAEFLQSKGLDPTKKTITLASGAEGVGNFPDIVNQLAREVKEPFQLIAVCANNKDHFEKLNAMKDQLPSHVTLKVEPRVPQEDLLSYIKSSDVYLTKAGGLSPTEGFAINKPMVIMEVYHGHEGENADLFERLDLAAVNRNPAELGRDVASLLKDPTRQEKMVAEQLKFRNALDIGRVTEFALKGKSTYQHEPVDFGMNEGSTVEGSHEALARLGKDLPSDAELILVYPKGSKLTDTAENYEMFGSLALRVKDKVYVVDPKPTNSQPIIHEIPYNDFLYATKSENPHFVFGDHIGVAYNTNAVGYRISEVDPRSLALLKRQIERINLKWAKEHPSAFTFGSAVIRKLAARAGLLNSETSTLGSAPLDVFNEFVTKNSRNPKIVTGLVDYTRIQGPHAMEQDAHAPISIKRPVTSTGRVTLKRNQTIATEPVDKRLTGYPGDNRLHYEDASGYSAEKIGQDIDAIGKAAEAKLEDLKEKEAHVSELNQKALQSKNTAAHIQTELKAFTDSVSNEELEALLSGQGEVSADKRDKFTKLKAQIEAADGAVRDFQEAYDAFNKEKIEFFVETHHQRLKNTLERLKGHLPNADYKKLEAKFAVVKKEYDDFQKNRELYNQPKDVKRINAVRQFFSAAQDMLQTTDATIATLEGKKQGSWMDTLKSIGGTVKWYSKMLPSALTMFGTLAMIPDQSRIDKSLVTNALMKGARGLQAAEGKTVTIENRERLKAAPGEKVVNLYTLQHANPVLDNMVLANLGIENASIFGDADSFGLGKWIANKLDRSNNFIVVGRGADKPIEKAVEIAKEGRRNFIIYPEGSVSAGVYESRRLRPKFSWGLVDRLQKEGYQVNIIPITVPDNYRYNTVWLNGQVMPGIDGGADKVRGVVHEHLDPKAVKILNRVTGDPETLTRHLRSLYMAQQPTDGDRISGLVKMEPLMERMSKFLTGRVNCATTSRIIAESGIPIP